MKFKFTNKYVAFGLTSFIVIIASIFAIFAFINIRDVIGIVSKLLHILSPIIYGIVISYLLSPCVNKFHNMFERVISNRSKNISHKTNWKISRILSLFATLFLTIVIISTIIGMIIPQLLKSIMGFIENFPVYFDNTIINANKLLDDNPSYLRIVDIILSNLKLNIDSIYNQIEGILPTINTLITSVTSSIVGIIDVFKNVFIGLIISIYLLYSKERFLAQIKKLTYAFMRKDYAENLFLSAKHTHKIFSGFIVGKILDSLIIGVLCFIVMSIFKWPFAILISVIIGVTNIIPFFGPFIGAIPSAIIILLVKPITCLYFIIFILILQQFDGNILGPKILGESTGLSCFWVIFAILVAGGMFGFIGMVIGVPCFAVIYSFVKITVKNSLEKKNLPTDTESYLEEHIKLKE